MSNIDTSRSIAQPSPAGKPRRIAFTLVAAFAAILTSILTMGSLGLLVGDELPDGSGLTPDGRLAILVHVPWLALGWCGAFVAMLWQTPQRIAAFQQAVAMGICLAIGGALAREQDLVFYVGFGAVLLLLGLLHPTRAAPWRPSRPGFSPVLVPFALLMAAPLTVYAVEMIDRYQAAGPDGPFYPGIANTALAVPLLGLVAGLRAPGWRLPLWVTGAMLVLLSSAGAAAIPGPPPASPPGAWPYLGLLAGIAFVVAGEWEDHRTRRVATVDNATTT